jgi:hypothetical protein
MIETMRWLSAIALALVMLPSFAQTADSASTTSSSYRSAFTGYRGLADSPRVPWREANDRVRDIGGWKAYAREAQGPVTDKSAASPANADNPHAQHHKQ